RSVRPGYCSAASSHDAPGSDPGKCGADRRGRSACHAGERRANTSQCGCADAGSRGSHASRPGRLRPDPVDRLAGHPPPYPALLAGAPHPRPGRDPGVLLWGGGDGMGRLLAFDRDKLEYKPAMATEMPKISADGKTYTFTLRNDLKWSDGSPVTVDDFQFAWDNASKPENQFVELDQLAEIASYKTMPDTRTIEITLQDQKARDVALGTVNVVGPIPKKIWENKSWGDASANPEILNPSVVLGPYKVQDFKIAEGATFVAVNTYPGGQAKIPQVQILPGQQPTVAYEALKSGRALFAPNIP